MQTFQYITDSDSYRVRDVPGHPGVREHLFYCKAQNVPIGVPAGCNPRFQNPDKPTYKKVTESFLDRGDMTFLLKNRGITVLATRVQEVREGKVCVLHVEVPDHLGDVDGHHTYTIISKYKQDNPHQMVHVRILESLPRELIPRVAEGLNTSVQVTTATMADHNGFFDLVKDAIKDKPYAGWISWKENQTNVSVTSKTLVSMMWVCNPLLLDSESAKLPSWIYTAGQRVFEGGFYSSKNESIRSQMLKMVGVLPQIIDHYIYINEEAPKLIPKARKSRSKIQSLSGDKPNEYNIGNLCHQQVTRPFHDPADRKKYPQLREAYLLIVLSGLRSLLQLNPTTDRVEWVVDNNTVRSIIDKRLKSLLKSMVTQLKQDRGNHNATPKQPSLWQLASKEMELEFLRMSRDNRLLMSWP